MITDTGKQKVLTSHPARPTSFLDGGQAWLPSRTPHIRRVVVGPRPGWKLFVGSTAGKLGMHERETRFLEHAKERVELLQVLPRGEHGRVHVKFHGKLTHTSEEVWHAVSAYSGR